MPTEEEIEELVENCTFLYTSKIDMNRYSVFGYKATGPNGNSIFLPVAGYVNEGMVNNVGSNGYYWSSSLDTYSPCDAYYVYFDSDNVYWSDNFRYVGRSVRPVCQ